MIPMEQDDFPIKPSRGKRWQRSRRARQRRKYTKKILQRKSVKTERELLDLLAQQIKRELIKRRKNVKPRR